LIRASTIQSQSKRYTSYIDKTCRQSANPANCEIGGGATHGYRRLLRCHSMIFITRVSTISRQSSVLPSSPLEQQSQHLAAQQKSCFYRHFTTLYENDYVGATTRFQGIRATLQWQRQPSKT
jgi:hypothetical protein